MTITGKDHHRYYRMTDQAEGWACHHKYVKQLLDHIAEWIVKSETGASVTIEIVDIPDVKYMTMPEFGGRKWQQKHSHLTK